MGKSTVRGVRASQSAESLHGSTALLYGRSQRLSNPRQQKLHGMLLRQELRESLQKHIMIGQGEQRASTGGRKYTKAADILQVSGPHRPAGLHWSANCCLLLSPHPQAVDAEVSRMDNSVLNDFMMTPASELFNKSGSLAAVASMPSECRFLHFLELCLPAGCTSAGCCVASSLTWRFKLAVRTMASIDRPGSTGSPNRGVPPHLPVCCCRCRVPLLWPSLLWCVPWPLLFPIFCLCYAS